MMSKKSPQLRFEGFTDDWEERKVGNFLSESKIKGSDGSVSKKLTVKLWRKGIVPKEEIYKGSSATQYYIRLAGQFMYGKLDFLNQAFGILPNELDGYESTLDSPAFDFKDGINPNFFLEYVCQENFYKYQGNIANGSRKAKRIHADTFFDMPIKIPSFEEQEKIGNFFKELDDAIALHQRKLEKTKALKSAYLSELFPVEGERKPKRRFAGFIDDWKQGTVGEYGYFYYGKSAPKWSVTKDAIIPCVRYGELYTKFGAKIDKVYSYTNISKENLKFSTGNEVLVPRVGEDPLDFANCSWLSIPNVAIGEMISVYNTEENPLFISYYFNSQLRHAFAKRVEGGNVSNLYFTYLENITISIPNKEEQDTIANFLESLDSVVEHHQHKLEKLKNIKQAYLNELFV